MRTLRASWRLSFFVGWTVFIYVLWLTGGPLLRRRGAAADQWRRRVLQLWGRVLLRRLRVHLQVSGTPPSAPCLLVSNHLSYVDMLVFAALVGCLFVSKDEVARWPLLGMIGRHMGMVFVDRSRRQAVGGINELVEEHLRAGAMVMLFPEATSTAGAAVLPFHSSLLEPAAKLGLPVAYATIMYRTPPSEPPAYQSICWWGDTTFVAHVLQLVRLPSFEAQVQFGPEPLQGGNRKQLARALHAAISRNFTPLVDAQLLPAPAPVAQD